VQQIVNDRLAEAFERRLDDPRARSAGHVVRSAQARGSAGRASAAASRGPCGADAESASSRRLFSSNPPRGIVDDLLHQALDLGVAQLAFVWPFELRIGMPTDRPPSGLAHVVATDVPLEGLQESVGLA